MSNDYRAVPAREAQLLQGYNPAPALRVCGQCRAAELRASHLYCVANPDPRLHFRVGAFGSCARCRPGQPRVSRETREQEAA